MTGARERVETKAPSGRTAAEFIDFPPDEAAALEGELRAASSRTIGECQLPPRIRKTSEETIAIAEDFSCRERIEQGGGRATTHVAELPAARMLEPPPLQVPV